MPSFLDVRKRSVTVSSSSGPCTIIAASDNDPGNTLSSFPLYTKICLFCLNARSAVFRAPRFGSIKITPEDKPLIDIDALTEQLGLVYRRQTPESIPDHNLRTAVIDAEGRLRKVIIGNTWKPEELVADMKEAATTPWPASPGTKPWTIAPG